MVFPTPAKLETHMKYSVRNNAPYLLYTNPAVYLQDFHAKNVKAASDESERKRRASEPNNLLAAAPAGKRCRELYSGSKFFWRQKETIELNIFHHLEQNVVEVCCYNNRAGVEYPRIYFSLPSIYKYVGEETITASIEARKLSEAEEDLKFSEEALVVDERRLAVSSHLIARLELVSDTNDPLKKIVTYRYTPSSVDKEPTNPQLEEKPDAVTPVLVARRRLSSADEIESVLQNIATIEASLHDTTQSAENLVDKMIDSNSKLLGSSRPTSPSGGEVAASAAAVHEEQASVENEGTPPVTASS